MLLGQELKFKNKLCNFLVVRLKRFLENLLECSVDIVRLHKHINPFLLKEIEHDGIYIIK